ncbi:MAG: hypothetical protein V2I35_14095, partial [Desulfocapsaceae bacterium]|nr:hypothetical protein [Desulfocapsaceae bacterium]
MNRNTVFFSLVCLTALLLLPPVLLHAAALRASDSVPLLQNDTTTTAHPSRSEDIRDIYGPVPLAEPPAYLLYAAVLLLFTLLGIGVWLLLLLKNKNKISENTDPAIIALRSLQ